MVPVLSNGVKLLFLVILLIPGNPAAANVPAPGFNLFYPVQGTRIPDNTPVFSWQSQDCDAYLVRMDGILIDTVRPPVHWYIPFPMSYGRHQWQVIAMVGDQETASETAEFFIEDRPLSPLPANAILLREGWRVISSSLAGKDGSAISRENVETGHWKTTSIPATVLSVMVRNGLYPNPYVGTNNMRIPDCNDRFNERYDLQKYSHLPGRNPWKEPYWYRREFTVSPDYKGKKIWLTVGEINYRAEVWFNGHQLADTSQVVGMEQRFRFDITSLARFGAANVLAISIYPPDHPGEPADPPLTPLASPGTNMADGLLSRDYTKWDVLGWDWIPAVRDRDMGITEDVFVYATGSIEVENLYVTSDLPLPDTTFADLTISLDLVNHDDHVKEGIIKASVTGQGHPLILEQSFSLGPRDTLEILWNPANMPRLHLEDPALWWPNGYGEPRLYNLAISAVTNSGEEASGQTRFGIREVGTYLGARERVYTINGREIYCKGGNWVLDMTLNWSARRYENEILLTKNANLNMLRIWGPTGAPPEAFYEAADAHGIMLWQDFLNDYWGTFRNRPGYRPDSALFEKATISIVKRYRNHPSLVIWGSGNEGPNPRESLIVNQILPAYDGRDSRHYLKISNGDGLHGGGPYHTIEPEAYFTDPKLNGFSSEIGPSGVPVYESVVKFMPELGKNWMPGRYPLDGTWAYHDANDWPGRDLRKFSSYDNIIRSFYGPTDSTSREAARMYLDKCQLLNHDVYKASIEAINSQLWDNSSGILLWKSNSSWPSMTWQIYDWYLQAHAGYYGVKKAAAPLSVQFNRNSRMVEVVNASFLTFDQAMVRASLYGTGMKRIWSFSRSLDLPESSATALEGEVPVPGDLCFLKLELTDQQGRILADNLYWLSGDKDFSLLNQLPEPEITVSWESQVQEAGDTLHFALENRGNAVAMMIELKLVDPRTMQEVLPSFWSDNYFTLLPGERRSVAVNRAGNHGPDGIRLTYRAYNMKRAGEFDPAPAAQAE